jgi:predicted enzyme related to lactoylglutathione lyase
MSVVGTAAVWLPVSDLDRAADFYVEKLGLRERQRGSDWVSLDANGLQLGLNASESPRGQGGAVVAFQTDEGLEDTVARLRDDGVQFADEVSDHPWGRVAPFKDPDGNDLQLYEPPQS